MVFGGTDLDADAGSNENKEPYQDIRDQVNISPGQRRHELQTIPRGQATAMPSNNDLEGMLSKYDVDA